MKKNKNGGNPDNNRGPIINGLKLIEKSDDPTHDLLAKHFYASGDSFIHSLHDNLGKIMTLTRDVFVTSLDLFLLDCSHSLLGGDARKLPHDDIEDLPAAEYRIRDILHGLSPLLPIIWTEIGASYFVPALTMPLAARVKFSQLSELEKLQVALRTKRVFVNGEAHLDYGSSGKQAPDAGFWSALFEFDTAHAFKDGETSIVTTDLAAGSSLAFWLERCIERDGGSARFVDHLDLQSLAAEDSENLKGSIRAFALEWGMDRKAKWMKPTRYGAVQAQAAG
jgi:hypothetical protein